MLKTLLKIIIGIALLVAAGIGAVFYFTSDMTDTADRFFGAIRDNDIDRSHALLSGQFRTTTSRDELARFVEANALTGYRDASWGSRSVESGRGRISGTVNLENGSSIPMTLDFIKEDGKWLIYALHKQASGLQDEASPVAVPGEEEIVDMVRRTDLEFAHSVNAGSMQRFHGYVSRLWQGQHSVEQLDQAFDSFYRAGVDLTVLENFAPQFTAPPVLDDQNILVVTGLYPTRPSQYHFEQKYVYEGLGWKLIGYKANIN